MVGSIGYRFDVYLCDFCDSLQRIDTLGIFGSMFCFSPRFFWCLDILQSSRMTCWNWRLCRPCQIAYMGFLLLHILNTFRGSLGDADQQHWDCYESKNSMKLHVIIVICPIMSHSYSIESPYPHSCDLCGCVWASAGQVTTSWHCQQYRTNQNNDIMRGSDSCLSFAKKIEQ